MTIQTIRLKTKEYIRALQESEEILAYKKAINDLENDTEAQKLLSEYQEAQQTYAVFRQGGFDGLQEAEQKLKSLKNSFAKNQKIQTLIKEQRSVQYFVANLVDEISKGIDIPFVKPQKSGCCG